MLTLLPQCSATLSVRFLHKGDDFALPEHCARVHQIHGARTIRVHGPMDATEKADLSAVALAKADLSAVALAKADGMITDVAELPLVIRVADCQSFAVYVPEREIIGVLHAGWRGLLAGAIEEFFAVLKREWDVQPSDVWVAAGPSLCQQCAEFTDPAQELPGIDPTFFDGRRVDLRGIADAKLISLGVRKDHIERHPECTRCMPGRYWTYRGGDREAVMKGQSNMLHCKILSTSTHDRSLC
ncbi:polyphenol oxidase family protein [Candidatus Peregrinibacteria bacterium]|nr:polyphenol oxidase family protein [Candidatus Peregrinibacteria bacterium]